MINIYIYILTKNYTIMCRICRYLYILFLYFLCIIYFLYRLQTSRINSLFTFKIVLNLKFKCCIIYSYRVFFWFYINVKIKYKPTKINLEHCKRNKKLFHRIVLLHAYIRSTYSVVYRCGSGKTSVTIWHAVLQQYFNCWYYKHNNILSNTDSLYEMKIV